MGKWGRKGNNNQSKHTCTSTNGFAYEIKNNTTEDILPFFDNFATSNEMTNTMKTPKTLFTTARKQLKHNMAWALAALMATACKPTGFQIEGSIGGAADSTLYLEHVTLEGPVTIDSVKLSEEGTFHFNAQQPETTDFYRLRIANSIINIAVDSTETIGIKAQYATMPTEYEVSGSEACKRIKQLAVKQIELTNKVIAIDDNQTLDRATVADSIMQLINQYKQQAINEFIIPNTKGAEAYFALFQTLGPYLIFDPQNNADDIKIFAAVATAWDTYRPGSLRGAHLHNVAIEGMKNERIMRAQQAKKLNPSIIKTAGLIDIELPDNKGKMRSLSQLKGKVVLLDFHAFSMEKSPQRILMLRELYSKYHEQGLEIYQVDLDGNEHYWKQQTSQLPWISVFDASGINSRNLALYNVQQVPEYFLIDRENNLVSRSQQIEDLEKAIEALL